MNMSALSGIMNYAGEPVRRESIASLLRHNAQRGPDCSEHVIVQSAALSHHALIFDECSARERQPHRTADGSVITFDGRLDNRADLLIRYGHDRDANVSDVELIGAAYTARGYDALNDIDGDWAVALYNESAREMVLACDYMGVRPLFYATRPTHVTWSTCLATLVAYYRLEGDIDESYVAGLLTLVPPSERTPFNGILPVPAGTMLVVRHDGTIGKRPLVGLRQSSIRFRDSGQYAERLRELVSDAVATRMRSSQPVWAQLSGGYDSSAVACMGSRLLRQRRVACPSLHLISQVYGRSPEADEGTYIAAVEAWCGIKTVRVSDAVDETIDDYAERLGPLAYGTRQRSYDIVSRCGGRTLLTGEMGDLIMGKTALHAISLVEHVYRGHLREFIRQAVIWSRYSHETLLTIIRNLAIAHVPAWLDRAHERLVASYAAENFDGKPGDVAAAFGLEPSFLKRVGVPTKNLATAVSDWPAAKRPLVRALLWFAGSESMATPNDVPLVRVTHPYLHRPLVEFMLAIPGAEIWRPGQSRALMRAAFKGLLPDSILARKGKGYAPPAVARRYRAVASALDERQRDWEIVARGYVVREALRRQLRGLADGSIRNPLYLGVWIHLETWLRDAPRLTIGARASEPTGHEPTPATRESVALKS